MRALASLYLALERTTSTNDKVEAIVGYLGTAPPRDAIWALSLLRGDRLPRAVRTSLLREVAAESSGLPLWLFEQCYATVGDLAETIALVVADRTATVAPHAEAPLHVWCETHLPALRTADDAAQRAQLLSWWATLPPDDVFVLGKLMTGGLRVGVSKGIVERALAKHTGLPRDTIALRLMGAWPRTAAFYASLVAQDEGEAAIARPYPFALASSVPEDLATLGEASAWQMEWKWDGIRGQVIKRAGACFLWSRGEELVNDAFPDVVTPLLALPDGTVLDGELLVVTTAGPQPFQQLQQRLQRRAPSASIQRRLPVRFRAYDVLEWQGEDLRATPLRQRRKVLDAVVANTPALDVSDVIDAPTWADAAAHRERAAQHGVEGLMLKRLESPYHTGRKRGDWWKWKVEPYVLDAVLLYAQAGHGRRASLFTDYTFGLWSDGELVTFAKAYSGLSDAEIRTLDGWIKANTIERFGPVRSVPRTQVFEIAFEGIARSTRHKAGVAVRFPRIKRWRTDKPATEADTLDALVALLDARNA